MKKQLLEEIIGLTNKLLLKEEYHDWDTKDESVEFDDEETETVYHELNTDENDRQELERHQETGNYENFKEFAQRKMKAKGFSDDQLAHINWDEVYSGVVQESKEQLVESGVGEDAEAFYVRLGHDGYSWAAAYTKQEPDDPFEGYGQWEPEVITQEDPHPDFFHWKFDAKLTPNEVAEELEELFDFVGTLQADPDEFDDESYEDIGPMESANPDTRDPFRMLINDISAIGNKKEISEGFGVDDTEARETDLYLYIVQSGHIYTGFTQQIIDSHRKKMNKGIYDRAKALKSWMNLADIGAKEYFKEFGDDIESELTWYSMFPSDIRRDVAKELMDYYNELVMADQNTHDEGFMESKEDIESSDTDVPNDTPHELKEFVQIMEDFEMDDSNQGKLERIQKLERQIYGDVLTNDLSELDQSPCDYMAFLMDRQNEKGMSSVPMPKMRARDGGMGA